MSELPKGEYKTNRKAHNQIFKYRQLKFFQYSTVIIGDIITLNIYVYKWFIALVAIPCLIHGSVTIGFIPTFKELVDAWKEPVSFDSLSKDRLSQISDRLVKDGKLPPQNK